MIRVLLLIGFGGGIGSVLRYLIGSWIQKNHQSSFPLATLIVNFLGCLIIGCLLGLFEKSLFNNQNIRYLLVVGFCGGFTTFSSFAAENLQLLQSGYSLTAFLYIALSILLCLFSVWLGCIIMQYAS